MQSLALHEFHRSLDACFGELNGSEIVSHYGDPLAEHTALRETAGVFDLSFRSRICLTGADRARFLHGQVTNDIKRLRAGAGCYAAITTAKGKMESDLNIYVLPDELLLDFEPGLTAKISQRLEKYIVADDVQVVDVAPHYGLLTVQGPGSPAVLEALQIFQELPANPFQSVKISEVTLGEIYLMNQPRIALPETGARLTPGFDLFVPTGSLGAVADKLIAAAKSVGGRACGWDAWETVRIEAGIPRYGADMDESNLPLECGIEARAVSYNKGCYIGQEVINRIHSIGHVNKELRGLRLADGLKQLPANGEKLFHQGKEVGCVTSSVKSAALAANIALGYVRREANSPGTELVLRGADAAKAVIVELPFLK
ncbi:MAG TPA: glycine cleavage T C-terminal barrel domain-containing protein [Verrucomicrobiae bacterium]|nr:glycine cleavage T C-terminal barrel domain-containing protein [Verrucomicrobiae bacterium]